jgi:hypothetical protein
MVAVRKEAEQTILLSEHLRIVREKDQKIHTLEKQLRFRAELDAVPSEIMSPAQKSALHTAVKVIETIGPDEKGRVLLKNTEDLAKSSGMSLQRFQKHLTYHDEIGVLKKETLPVRDDNGKILYTETYVRPTILTFSPRTYTTEKARNHGGDRLTCRCGSERIRKETRYICMDCGEVHTSPPRFEPPAEPVEPETQVASTVNCQQKTEHLDTEPTPVESNLVPETQVASTVNCQQKTDHLDTEPTPVESNLVPETQVASTVNNNQNRNLTLISNNLLQSQLDSTVKDESNKTHTHTSPANDPNSILKEWFDRRCGSEHIIYATGSLDPNGKYKYADKGYQPDVDAYIFGDKNHIYGSRLLNPDTGLTNVLCFEIDKAEQDEQAENYLLDLARAGIAPVYWQRHALDRRRGHLEIYFSHPVNPETARQFVLEVCPDLEEIPECYPCKVPEDKRKQGLSWPMYQRIGETVYPCTAKYILPDPHDGSLQECAPTDKQALAQLVILAVTPATLVEEFATVLSERENLQPHEQERARVCVCFIGQKPKRVTQVQSERDLVPRVIADFNASCSWDDIAAMCGGWEKGFFKAVWRGERTASVRPDKDERYACDYGNHGSFPRKLDTYGAYCLIHGIDQKADLAERCAQLRRQQGVLMDKEREALESFVKRVQSDIPALKDARVEYQRKDQRESERKSEVKHYWL